MAPLVYISNDKLGKMKILADTCVCLYKNSTAVDGHNSLSTFPINIIHTFLFPSSSLSSMLSTTQTKSKKNNDQPWKKIIL